jgi:hypothetical protein
MSEVWQWLSDRWQDLLGLPRWFIEHAWDALASAAVWLASGLPEASPDFSAFVSFLTTELGNALVGLAVLGYFIHAPALGFAISGFLIVETILAALNVLPVIQRYIPFL